MGAPLPNPDVPLNAAPGSYFYISQQGQQPPAPSGVVNGAGRMNILAYRKGGSAPANTPTQVFGLDDCDGFFGAKSDVRRIVARILSSGRTGLNLIVTGVEEPSAGTARTFPLAFSGTATGGGVARLRIVDDVSAATVTVGDAATAVCTALQAAAALRPNIPCTPSAATPVLTLTATCKGLVGNDLPVALDFDDSVTGLKVSIGTITLANNSDGATKAITVTSGLKSVTYTYPGAAEAPATSATNFAAAITARGDFPCTAEAVGAVVTLYMRNRRVCHRPSVVTTDTSQTATLAAAGTAGAGTPDLTLALQAAEASDACQEWVTSFNDATSLGTLVSHLEAQANGYVQKEQFLTYGSTSTVIAAGALASSAAPSLNLYWRYSCVWCADAFQPAYELAALRAAARCAVTRPTANLDYLPLTTDGSLNLTFPDVAVRPTLSTRGIARATYYLTPLIVNNGQLCIESDITTYGGGYKEFTDSPYGHGVAFVRLRVNAGLSLLRNKELVQFSTPRVPEVLELGDVEANIYNTYKDLEQENLFDGAAKVQSRIKATVDPNNGTWIRAAAPIILPRVNHVIAGQIAQASQAS